MELDAVEVRWSKRRQRTIAVSRRQGRLVADVPYRTPQRVLEEILPGLVSRYLDREAARRPPSGDAALTSRAEELAGRWLVPALGEPLPAFSIRWVSNQRRRWGSCTPSTGAIRLSDRGRDLPGWVVDYVILHELVHLVEPAHGKRFHALLGGYPLAERARGFLEGVSHHAD